MKYFFLIINGLSMLGLLMVVAVLMISEIIGYDKTDHFLENFGIPFNTNHLIVLGFVFLLILIIVMVLKRKNN